MSKETVEARVKLDLSIDELAQIKVLLDGFSDTLVGLLGDPSALLEDLSVAYEADRIKKLARAQTILSQGRLYFVEQGEVA